MSAVFDGKFCDTVEELRRAIFPQKPVFQDGYPPAAKAGANCLCPVDFAATAAVLERIACRRADDDPMRVWFMTAEAGPDYVPLDDD